jgi:hypothetical protein
VDIAPLLLNVLVLDVNCLASCKRFCNFLLLLPHPTKPDTSPAAPPITAPHGPAIEAPAYAPDTVEPIVLLNPLEFTCDSYFPESILFYLV